MLESGTMLTAHHADALYYLRVMHYPFAMYDPSPTHINARPSVLGIQICPFIHYS